MSDDSTREYIDQEQVEPGALRVVPGPAEEPAQSRRGLWWALIDWVGSLRAQVRALPHLFVDRQLNRPLPKGIQERVPGWMQTMPGRIGVALVAVLVMGLWGLGLLVLTGLP